MTQIRVAPFDDDSDGLELDSYPMETSEGTCKRYRIGVWLAEIFFSRTFSPLAAEVYSKKHQWPQASSSGAPLGEVANGTCT
ncbi:hypothetical protein Bca52824_040100 [Brassica carinata]|uniref:Uncharacterized protein n=1 Tax=Brassica carinata TaxID=52824 RepID=A0A8X7UXJ3_BRACI|nr:hypothetical protein Bca52824_040100 [Brassica carinata]